MASFCSTFARPLSSFLEGGRNRAKRPAVRPGSNRVPVIMCASFFRSVLRNKTGFPKLCDFLFGAIRVPVRPEITHRLPTKRDAKPLKKYAAATRLLNLEPYLLGNGAGLVSQAAGHNLSL